ncbi:MAG: VacJ family lipoprotein [Alphaproteobacteria bacterium]|nr:VacJ family lipoprotein [Alphaproteobacteria bacterium]
MQVVAKIEKSFGRRRHSALAVFVLPFFLAACASGSDGQAGADFDTPGTEFGSLRIAPDGPNDPFEDVNRAIFSVNQQLDRFVFEPIAITYTELTPEPVRDSVRTALRNLSLPLNAVHAILQGKFDEAGDSVERFVTNAVTLWLGDLKKDMPYPDEDAGQTLAVAGFPEGPFLVLPLLGPSNVRDALGRIIDTIIDPVGFAIGPAGGIARTVTDGVDTRARIGDQLAEIEATSLDFYATLRSLYNQNRRSLIRDDAIDPLHVRTPTVTVELGGDFGDDFASGFGADTNDDADIEGPQIVSADVATEQPADSATTGSDPGSNHGAADLTASEGKYKPDVPVSDLKKLGIDVEFLSAGEPG